MNILVNYLHGNAAPKIMGGFINGLRDLGHVVTDFPTDKRLTQSYDLLLGYSGCSVIELPDSPYTLAHAFGARLVQYWAHDTPDPDKVFREGTILQSDEGCWNRWRQLGIECGYLPLATDPFVFQAIDLSVKYDVVMTGLPSPDRVDALRRLAGLGVGVFGPWQDGWEKHPEFEEYYQGYLASSAALNVAYNESLICLDASSPKNLNSANFTVFNAMASGCLLITNDKPILDVAFGDAKPPTYADDCRPIIDAYLEDPDLLRETALAQREEILRAHTFTIRARQLLDAAEQDPPLQGAQVGPD